MNLGCKWFSAFSVPPHWHRASCVSSRSDASGARTSFSSSCSVAQDSVGVSHGFPSVKISLEASRPSSSSDWSSCPFHCHGADHFPFHWVPFHDHRDMSSAHQRKHLPAARTCKKRHETRAHPSGLKTIVHTCTYKEPIQQRTKLGKHGGRAIEVIKYYRATLISDATSSESRTRLAFGGSETFSRLSLHLFRNLCSKAFNLPVASASCRHCCHYLLRGPVWLALLLLPFIRTRSICCEDDSRPRLFSRPSEQWEVPARFDPSKHFVRLLAVDCRPEHVHHFHHPLNLGRSLH